MDERGKYTFLFQAAFNEMLADFAKHQPSLVSDGKKYLMTGQFTISVRKL